MNKYLLTFLLAGSLGCASDPPESDVTARTEPSIEQPESILIDSAWSNAARFLAGRELLGTGFRFDSTAFNEYSESMTSDFEGIRTSRLIPLTDWASAQLSSAGALRRKDVVYPFSGGDFLHMYQLYPDANDYLMLAIEPVGTIPVFSQMAPDEQLRALSESKSMLRDIFSKSYFITLNMQTDIRENEYIKGILPSVLWGIAITGHDIISVSSATISNSGSLTLQRAALGDVFDEGIQISFTKSGTDKTQRVTYFSQDISDEGLAKAPEFSLYLSAQPEFNSFMKAASYLPHYETFSTIREAILSKSTIHIQDDTGIPFRYFSAFAPQLYGEYVTPVRDFDEGLFQTDLAAAYEDPEYFRGALPFSMGYHWGSKAQNQMIFLRTDAN